MDSCSLCGKTTKLLSHHTSYKPEETIEICKSCHWSIHRPEIDTFYPAPYKCPMRTESITCIDVCLISCSKDDCLYSFRNKHPKCTHPGSNSPVRQERRKQGLCEWNNRACRGLIQKCPDCGFSYCEHHRHWVLDQDGNL